MFKERERESSFFFPFLLTPLSALLPLLPNSNSLFQPKQFEESILRRILDRVRSKEGGGGGRGGGGSGNGGAAAAGVAPPPPPLPFAAPPAAGGGRAAPLQEEDDYDNC